MNVINGAPWNSLSLRRLFPLNVILKYDTRVSLQVVPSLYTYVYKLALLLMHMYVFMWSDDIQAALAVLGKVYLILEYATRSPDSEDIFVRSMN